MSQGYGYKQKQFEDAQKKAVRESVLVGCIAQVKAFNAKAMTVDVKPLSKDLQGGSYTSASAMLGIPVMCFRGGGLVVRPWYKEGDIGAVLYIDHDIDKAMAGAECEPNTERNHSPEDGIFVGGLVPSGAPLEGLPDDAVVIGTADGSVYLAVSSKGIEIKGDITHKGNTDQEGETTISQELTVSGIPYTPHTHTSTAPGSETSPPH